MRRSLPAVLLAALALALGACGNDDETQDGGGQGAAETPTATAEPEGGATTLELSSPASGALEFSATELTAPAGEITIDYVNESDSVPHAVTLENGTDATTPIITGADTSLTVTLDAGEYTFFCPVDGHREAGMEGTLTVE